MKMAVYSAMCVCLWGNLKKTLKKAIVSKKKLYICNLYGAFAGKTFSMEKIK